MTNREPYYVEIQRDRSIIRGPDFATSLDSPVCAGCTTDRLNSQHAEIERLREIEARALSYINLFDHGLPGVADAYRSLAVLLRGNLTGASE